MSLTLNDLIAACKQGDPKAQEQLFLEFRDPIYTTSLKYCRNVEEAQDNVHDAFVIVFETLHKYKGKGSFAGWMQRIAINQAVKKYRVKRKEHLTEDPSWFALQEDDPQWVQDCDLDSLLEAIQNLPDQYRLVFSLYVLDDHSHQEIADKLKISPGTSKSNLHRAKALLKKSLAPKLMTKPA